MLAVQNEIHHIEGVMLSSSIPLVPSWTIGESLASFLDSSVISAQLLFSVWVLIIHVGRLELGCWLLDTRGVDLFAHWCRLIVNRFIIITNILVSVVYDQSKLQTRIGTYTIVGLQLNKVTCKEDIVFGRPDVFQTYRPFICLIADWWLKVSRQLWSHTWNIKDPPMRNQS